MSQIAFFLYLFQRAICYVPGRSFHSSPWVVWWGANTLYVPYTFISDVDLRVLRWDAFCFHRTFSKNTTKLGCQGDYMKPKWYTWYLILKARPSKNSVCSCNFKICCTVFLLSATFKIFKNMFPGKGHNSQLLEEVTPGVKHTQAGTFLGTCQFAQYLHFQERWALSR